MKTNAQQTKHKNYIQKMEIPMNGMQKKNNQKKNNQKNKQSIFGMAKGLVVALAITCIFFIGYGIGIAYYNMPYDQLPIVVLVCTAVSSLVVGYDFAIHSEKKGVLIGGVGGVVYILLLCLIVHLAEGTIDFAGSVWKMGIVAVLSGAIGGIFGANQR